MDYLQQFVSQGDSFNTLGNELFPVSHRYDNETKEKNCDDYIEPYFLDPSISINVKKDLYVVKEDIPSGLLNNVLEITMQAKQSNETIIPVPLQQPPDDNVVFWD